MVSTVKPQGFNPRAGFTLIELLVVIAIVAVLSVVVILTLNPAQLLKQARDSTRLSDMASISRAISIFQVDQGGPLGITSTTYVSIADTSATCANLGLPSLPAGYTYNCVTTSTLRNTDGTGWIPVNFKNMSTGAPLSALPIDPNNASSSRLYYTYTADSGVFEVTAAMESSKYKLGGGADVVSTDGGQYPDLLEKGTSLTLEPLDYGDSALVGYWTFNEGNGSTAYDASGNGNNGTLSLAAPTWTTGKVGSGALSFNGSNNSVNGPTISSVAQNGPATIAGWFNFNTFAVARGVYIPLHTQLYQHPANDLLYLYGGGADFFDVSSVLTTGAWHFIALTYNGTHETDVLYVDGIRFSVNIQSPNINNAALSPFIVSPFQYFPGLIDDVRIYNRVLSADEIAAIYSAGN